MTERRSSKPQGAEAQMAPTPEQEYLEKLEKIVKKAVKPDFDKVNSKLDGIDGQLTEIQTTLKAIQKKLP